MIIQDIEGRSITIIDLQGTIDLIEGFISYVENDPEPSLQRLENRRLEYWHDLHKKLLTFKKRLTL